ncbi:MAG: hypothetical protein ABI658_30830 [Acidimicrobiales bacterium]
MTALLEGNKARVEHAGTGGQEAEANAAARETAQLQELVARCRELLAKRATGDCPPGHWLG